MIKLLFSFLIFIFLFSCSTNKKFVKKVKKIRKSPEIYIPHNADSVIKNNKFNKILFNKDYSPFVIYNFNLNGNSYLISTKKIHRNSLKLNYYYLSPKTHFKVGEFKYDLSDFDFLYHKNLFRIIYLNTKKLILFSTGNNEQRGEIPKEISIFNTKNYDFLIEEDNPVFYKDFIKFINFSYEFKSIKSYFIIKYSNKYLKKQFYQNKVMSSYILIITLKNFEEISQFKKQISKTCSHYNINLKDVFSNNDKTLYIFFNGDKIIFAKNMNSLKLLDNLIKIPLTKLSNNFNSGYIITKNKKYLQKIFKIFKEIKFNGKIIYYFFDYKK